MSLLRRSDRFPSDATWTEDAQFPLPDGADQSADETWCRRWSQRPQGRLLAMAMMRDGQGIVVGTRTGWVLFYDYTGRLIWRAQVEGAVHRIALAEEARCVLVGTAERGHAAHLFHFDGRRLRTFEAESEAWGIDLLPDASLIAVGGLNGRVTLYDRNGTVIAARSVEGPIRHAVLLPDGAGVLVGGDSGVITALDRTGHDLWQYRTGGRIWAGMRVAQAADLVFAGSNDHTVCALNRQGQLQWSYDTGGLVNAVAVTPDGQYCAAAGSGNTVFWFDAHGQVIWQHSLEQPIYGLALSADGRVLALNADDNVLYVVERAVEHDGDYGVWSTDVNGRAYGLAITPDGQSVAAAVTSQGVQLFDHRGAGQGGGHDTGYGTVQYLLGRVVVKRVRDDYARDCHAGLVRWFTEFQRSLRGRQYGVCQALLDEIDDGRSYHLNDGEQQVIRSLEGVRWLFEGVDYHRQGQVEAARACYERSKAIQASVNNKDGVGQVIAALAALPAPAAEVVVAVEQEVEASPAAPSPAVAAGEVGAGTEEAPHVDVSDEDDIDADPYADVSDDSGEEDSASAEGQNPVERLLDDIVRRPRILGTSEKLLEQRLIGAPPPEQYRIIVLARQAGYLLPLLRGLEANERLVRAAASAALTFLQPGPGDDVLARMLQSSQSFVRWNAVRMMVDRAENRAEQFEASRAQLWPLALNPEGFDSLDALARREVALLVEVAGTGEDTPWLVARLGDPDADVRLAAIDALAKVGRREALDALNSLSNASGFLGRSVEAAAKDAVTAIEARDPKPSISRVYVCSPDPLANRRVSESTLFLSDQDAVYCVVDLDHAQVGAPVRVRWLTGSTTLHEEVRTLVEELPPVASVQELGSENRPQSPFNRPVGSSSYGATSPRYGSAPGDAGDRPAARPFGARSTDQPVEPPSFLRREPAAPGARPGVPRSDAPRPGAPRPDAPRADAPPAFGARPGAQPAAQPAARPPAEGGLSRFLPSRGTEPSSRPAPAPDRSSPFRRPAEPESRPSRPGFPLQRRRFPSLFDEEDRAPVARSPFGRFPGGPVADPLENIDPEQGDSERSASSPSARPTGSPTSNPFTRRDAPAPARPAQTGPRPASGDLPDWLLTDEEEDNSLFGMSRPGGGRPGRSSNQPASTYGARRYGDQDEDEDTPGDRVDGPFGSTRRSARNGTITHVAFALPRPEAGWPGMNCQCEIELVDSGVPAVKTSFRFVDVPQIARLEPGFMPTGRGATFAGTRRFLTTAGQIACQVHLTDAPANTRVVGRCYDAHAGTLMGETSAHARAQGNSSVLLQWVNNGWPAAAYRIEVNAEGSRAEADAAPQVGQRQTTIDLIESVSAARVSVCHRVDEQNGPVGAGWPLRPGDLPWCVVEFDDPPPEIDVKATWYSRNDMLHRSRPVKPIISKGQRAAFQLQLSQNRTLEPGFYSVVIDGEHVSRQEQIFEVRQHDWWTRLKPHITAARDPGRSDKGTLSAPIPGCPGWCAAVRPGAGRS